MSKKIKKKSKTKNQLAWEKEEKRVKAFIRRAKKRGYIFDSKAISDITKKPKRITQRALQQLRSETTPVRLYSRSEYVKVIDEENGTAITISGLEGRREERKRASERAIRTKAERGLISVGNFSVIETLKEILRELSGNRYVSGGKNINLDNIQDRLLTILENELEQYDFDSVEFKGYINHLQLDVETCRGNVLDIIFYDSTEEQVRESTDDIIQYLKWHSLTIAESIEISENDYYGLEDNTDWDY